MGLLDADITQPQFSGRKRYFGFLIVVYPLLFIGLGIGIIYWLVSRQTQFDPALGKEGAIWLNIYIWIVLSTVSLCGHIVAVIMNRSITERLTARQVVQIMALETALTLVVMFGLTILAGEWTLIMTPLVMAGLVSWLLRKYKPGERTLA